MLVMLANKHTESACLLCCHSDHTARGNPLEDTLMRTPLWSTMMKEFPSGNGPPDPKQADRNASRQLAPCPQVSIFPPPLLGNHPMVTSLLDWREVIILPMKDGNDPPNPPQQDTPVPRMPCKQSLRQETPGLSGTQWSEDLSRQPSQHNEPPIPGPSPSSEPHEDLSAHEPEPEVARMHSLEEPFAGPATPCLVIIIKDMPVGSSPIPSPTPPVPSSSTTTLENPTSSSPHSHYEAWQEFTSF
ncbi:hypothetical protein O181_043164 [Austropuccinia psidii MF-1]|uniref:Uncharacterized protein n=1 Tax=Austropuccinia psidii MF-1 TaxID=1389203 RepID=A0A9Q3DHH2_9BASI|nr:hypothetical protein [Austropuccinia psidii MF-1]